MAQEGMNPEQVHPGPAHQGQREIAKKLVLDAMNQQAPACPTALSPQEATDAIEDEVYAMHSCQTSVEYVQKMSAVQTLVKGPSNFQIRHAVLRGHIPPEHIVRVDAEQLKQRAKDVPDVPGIPDAKTHLVVWRRQHPDMPPSMKTFADLQRLVMPPLSEDDSP